MRVKRRGSKKLIVTSLFTGSLLIGRFLTCLASGTSLCTGPRQSFEATCGLAYPMMDEIEVGPLYGSIAQVGGAPAYVVGGVGSIPTTV